jgi:hypothetical protein
VEGYRIDSEEVGRILRTSSRTTTGGGQRGIEWWKLSMRRQFLALKFCCTFDFLGLFPL